MIISLIKKYIFGTRTITSTIWYYLFWYKMSESEHDKGKRHVAKFEWSIPDFCLSLQFHYTNPITLIILSIANKQSLIRDNQKMLSHEMMDYTSYVYFLCSDTNCASCTLTFPPILLLFTKCNECKPVPFNGNLKAYPSYQLIS